MKIHWTDAAIAAALVAGGCIAIYACLSRAIRRALQERQQTTERQLNALTTTVQALQARVAEMTAELAARPAISITPVPACAANDESDPVKPEIAAVLAAATTTFLGKRVRVRSAQPLAAQQGAGGWAQQGRVSVQTSHNLRGRDGKQR